MRPRFFYGYVIIALCFANMVVMRGVNGAFGVYYLALLEEFPWSRSAGASIASANFFVYASLRRWSASPSTAMVRACSCRWVHFYRAWDSCCRLSPTPSAAFILPTASSPLWDKAPSVSSAITR